MNKFKHLTVFMLSTMVAPALAQDLPEANPDPVLPEPSGVPLDSVVAIVNEGVVLQSELDYQKRTIIQRAQQAGMQLPPDDILQEQILEKLIVEEVQLQRADRYGIRISDQQLNAAIQSMLPPEIKFEDLPEELAKDGIAYADYRNEMRRQVILNELRRAEVMRSISVSEREVDACLADIEDNVVENTEYNLSHIFISVPESATNAEFQEAEQEANRIHEEISGGADFAEMAVRHSDSDSALQGGVLGWRPGGELPTLFFDVLSDMQEGDVAEPVRNVSGFHIVKVNEMRGANKRSTVEQTNVRHILIMPNEIIDDATAQQRLEDAREQILAGEEEFAEMAKLLSDDPGSGSEGGEMGWTSPGTFVPTFEQVANEAEIGVISEPFRTQFGWHILEVLGRRTYDNTQDLKVANCQNRVRNSKLASETELWTRRIRDEAYVDIRI